MPESFRTKITRLGFNFFPAYFGTGAWISYLADDYHELHLKLPLSWRTRNYVGTIFGGSMFGAIDPILMVMFINILGRDYVVWDKSANIQFKRPGKDTLYAKVLIKPEEIVEIKAALETTKSLDRVYRVELVNKAGKVHAIIEKTLYFSKKDRNNKK
jgi:acyl-coenzyme A thioesterase PaaI-like protein